MTVEVIHGDCLETMAAMQAAGRMFDCIVTDPPYELGFMGKGWDRTGIANSVEMWKRAYDLIKPGGHLLAFSGSRTYHRMVCAIEDAGFEIRDQIMWLYGTGFPKSLDVSKAIDKAAGAEREVIGERPWTNAKMEAGNGVSGLKQAGGYAGEYEAERVRVPITAPATPEAAQWAGWGTALKPAHEPIVVARKPLIGTVAQNVLEHGTGALNIDACRVALTDGASLARVTRTEVTAMGWAKTGYAAPHNDAGRWPANVIHDGSDDVLDAFAAFGESKSTGGGRKNGDKFGGGYAPPGQDTIGFGDTGTAARFYYSAKASKADRAGSKHPCIKPLALMRWLVRLICPPGGTVLDPFAGSGTTGLACRAEGFDCSLIEREAEHVASIRHRLSVAPELEAAD